MTPEEKAKSFLKNIYDKKHPVIWHLRINQGFHIDEVVEAMRLYELELIYKTTNPI
jgi:hypothetical protein